MAGRPRIADAIHEITGAKRKDPQRFRHREPPPDTPGPIGDPPEEFNLTGDRLKLIAKWKKIVSEAPIGLLTASDREYVAAVCRMGVESERTGSRKQMQAIKHYGEMLKGLAMTPDGRAIRGIGGKVSTKKESDPLGEFRKRA